MEIPPRALAQAPINQRAAKTLEEAEREPTTLAVSLVLNELVPLARLMGEQIQALRTWAKGRARLATTPPEAAAGRKLAA